MDKVHSTKTRIKNHIDSVDDELDLLRFENFLHRKEVDTRASRIVQSKFGKDVSSVTSPFAEIILNHNSNIDEKIDFLDTLFDNNGLWDGSQLLTNKSGNIYNLMTNRIANETARFMSSSFTGKLGLGPDQGPGEMLMVLTGIGVNLANVGDLNILDKLVEVKATAKGTKSWSGGRLYSTSGYGSNSTIKTQLSQAMYSEGISKKILHKYLALTPKTGRPTGGFNLNESGLTNLNKRLSKLKSYKATCNVLNTIVTGLYEDLNKSVNWSGKVVNSDGSFDAQTVICFLIEIAHDYYQSKSNHDSVMYFNCTNGNYALVEDSDEYEALFQAGSLMLTSHIDWNSDRGKGSAQIIKT